MSRFVLAHRMKKAVVILILAATLTACANASPIPEPTLLATSTQSQSSTPSSTSTFQPTKTSTPIPTPTQQPTETPTSIPNPTSTPEGFRIDPNYLGLFGPAEITPVSCYNQKYDSSAVKAPEKEMRFRNISGMKKNGVDIQMLQIENLVVTDCQMSQVVLMDQKDVKPFMSVTLTLMGKINGVDVFLVLHRRGMMTMDGSFIPFLPGWFSFRPGDEVCVDILSIPSGNFDTFQKFVTGMDREMQIRMGNFGSVPFSSTEIIERIKSGGVIRFSEAEVSFPSIDHQN